MSDPKPEDLFTAPMRILNIGLEGFAQELESLDVSVVHVDWRPPAGGDPRIANLLSKLGS